MKLNLAAILVLLMVIISALMDVPLDRSNRQVAAADKSRLSLKEANNQLRKKRNILSNLP